MAITSPLFFGASGFYPYEINSSMRFSKDHSASINRTMTSTGNRKVYTFSCWVKRNQLGDHSLLSVGSTTDDRTEIIISDDALMYQNAEGGDRRIQKTNTVMRDCASWYHICVGIDLSSGGNSQAKVKLFVNGGAQETDLAINNTMVDTHSLISTQNSHTIGVSSYATSSYADLYLAEVHFVGGSQLDPTSFTETKNGILIPKFYTGSHGTNGFYLKFNQIGSGTASSSTMGADSSGNDNHFSQSNVNPIDSNLPDSPTNKFCVLNQLRDYGGGTVQIGGLKFVSGTSEFGPATGTFAVSSGKWYAELDQNSATSTFVFGAVRTETKLSTGFDLGNAGSFGYRQNGQKNVEGTVSSYGASWSQNDIIGMALNMDDNEVTFYKNNSSQGTFSITAGEYSIAVGDGTSGALGAVNLNFGADSSFNNRRTKANNADGNGQGDFFYSPPSGFIALCAANLPEPSISPLNGEEPTDYFNTLLVVGTGSTASFTGVGFQPDWSWVKRRDNATNGHHIWYDAIRGGTNALRSSTTGAEAQFGDTVLTFESDGFQLEGTDGPNASSQSNVAWNWKAGGVPSADNSAGAGATPTANSVKIDGSNLGSALAGTIAATRLTANTEAGFSIVSYTGSGSNATVAHGLGVAPKWVIVKKRNDGGDWDIWHQGMGDGTKYMVFSDQALLTATNIWNSTIPTSSVFSVGTHNTTNGSSDTFIAYCFAEIEGYSRFGKYTGTGEADGPFVYTGFRPAWLMYKNISSSSTDWIVKDSVRQTENMMELGVRANKFDAEESSLNNIDFLSNGIKFLSTGSFANDNNDEFIYMAFAEAPFKYANAR